MKIEYTDATGCPHGQFVILAESVRERFLLRAFLSADRGDWTFHQHGQTYDTGPGIVRFHFGWIKRRRRRPWWRRLFGWAMTTPAPTD